MRYCVRARSVCRIDSLRFRPVLFVFPVVGSAELAARSSIVSIYTPPPISYLPLPHFKEKRGQDAYLPPNPIHHPLHQRRRPREELRDRALGDPEAREELVIEGCGFGGLDVGVAVDGGEDVVDVHGCCYRGVETPLGSCVAMAMAMAMAVEV